MKNNKSKSTGQNKQFKVIVLGAGRVGHLIARDLDKEKNIEVTMADRREGYLDEVGNKTGCTTICENLADMATIKRTVSNFDLAIGALPGAMGFNTMKAVISAKKPIVDISFMPEDPRKLNSLAKKNGCVAIYDFGVAPGMSNLIAARIVAGLKTPKHLSIMVGGLPAKREGVWEYVAPFSPADVMEEYIRSARIIQNQLVVEREPLSGLEKVSFQGVGPLEAFYSDGLRSLLDTVKCPSMEEKTLRYPGYAEKIKLLKSTGFLDEEPVDVNGTLIVPMQITYALLKNAWKMKRDTDDFTVMRIIGTGGDKLPYQRITWDLLDRNDRKLEDTSMARTTGFPAALVARKMLDGSLNLKPGIHPPEVLADDDNFFSWIINELKKRKVQFLQTKT